MTILGAALVGSGTFILVVLVFYCKGWRDAERHAERDELARFNEAASVLFDDEGDGGILTLSGGKTL